MISLLVCGPYVYENDTLQECLLHAKMSLSFLIALISVCTQAHLRKGGGWRGVTTDWLALFIIVWRFILDLYTQVKSTFLHVPHPTLYPSQLLPWRESVAAISAQAVTEMSTIWKHASWHFQETFRQAWRFSSFPTCHWLTSLLHVSLSFINNWTCVLSALQHMLRY